MFEVEALLFLSYFAGAIFCSGIFCV